MDIIVAGVPHLALYRDGTRTLRELLFAADAILHIAAIGAGAANSPFVR